MLEPIKELARQGLLGTALTETDWTILLQDASDFGSIDGVLTASIKLHCKPPKETLENLLLSALCKGEYSTAYATAKALGRGLQKNEKNLLLQGAILSGNVQEMFNHTTIDSVPKLGIFHTTAAIAVCRSIREKEKLELPYHVNLKEWSIPYAKELLRFNLTADHKLDLVTPLAGLFFIFTQETSLTLAGALLCDNLVNKECANALINLKIM